MKHMLVIGNLLSYTPAKIIKINLGLIKLLQK